MDPNLNQLKNAVRNVPDFPQTGVLFKDITPILSDPKLFRQAIALFVDRYKNKKIDKIVAIEARGFIFGSVIAHALNIGFVPIRKKGKLPYKTIDLDCTLEYGTATLSMHVDALKKGEKVLFFDDLLATGGTASAAATLIEKLGGEIVEMAFLIELAALKGRERLTRYPLYIPVVY